MTDLLQQIIDTIVCWIETAAIFTVNFLIEAVANVISIFLLLLPAMPTLPSVPAAIGTGYGYASYWFPVGYTIDVVLSCITIYVTWMGVVIVLRWARAVRGQA